MLDFDDETFMKLMEVYDSDGSGVIDFRKFCENVMGSDSSKRSSLMRDMDNLKKVGQVSDDRGNSVQMIKRKVRTNWKELTCVKLITNPLPCLIPCPSTVPHFWFLLRWAHTLKELVFLSCGRADIHFSESTPMARATSSQLGYGRCCSITISTWLTASGPKW